MSSKNKNKREPVTAQLHDNTKYFDNSKFKIQTNDINMQNILNYRSQLSVLRYTKFKKYNKLESKIWSVSSNDLSVNLHNYEIEDEDEQTDHEIVFYKEQLHNYNTRLIRYFEEEDYCIYCRNPGHLQRYCPQLDIFNESPCCNICMGKHKAQKCPVKICCDYCHQPGHVYKKCPEDKVLRKIRCQRCGKNGHLKADCNFLLLDFRESYFGPGGSMGKNERVSEELRANRKKFTKYIQKNVSCTDCGVFGHNYCKHVDNVELLWDGVYLEENYKSTRRGYLDKFRGDEKERDRDRRKIESGGASGSGSRGGTRGGEAGMVIDLEISREKKSISKSIMKFSEKY